MIDLAYNDEYHTDTNILDTDPSSIYDTVTLYYYIIVYHKYF